MGEESPTRAHTFRSPKTLVIGAAILAVVAAGAVVAITRGHDRDRAQAPPPPAMIVQGWVEVDSGLTCDALYYLDANAQPQDRMASLYVAHLQLVLWNNDLNVEVETITGDGVQRTGPSGTCVLRAPFTVTIGEAPSYSWQVYPPMRTAVGPVTRSALEASGWTLVEPQCVFNLPPC